MKICTKRKDTGKWWSFGNIKPSDKGGWRIGIKKSPELMALINDTKDGEWINFLTFEDDKENKTAPKAQPELSDEIPF